MNSEGLRTKGVTKVLKKKFSYEWAIENFINIVREPSEYILSSEFSSDSKKEDVWCLKLYPNGASEESEGYLSVYLILVSTKRTKEEVTYHLSVIDFENSATMKTQHFRNFSCENGQTKSWGRTKFLKRDTLFTKTSELLPNGTLTIYCDAERVTDIITIEIIPELSPIEIPNSTLADQLGLAVKDEIFGDVLFKIGESKLRASKTILAARSPVFAGMFSHETMKENQTNQVDIEDIEENVFRELLHFIYTDTAPKLNGMPKELLAAAEKYQLDRLKIMCEKALDEKISIDNVLEIFHISEMYNAEKLKNATLKFMKGREFELLKANGYEFLEEFNKHQDWK